MGSVWLTDLADAARSSGLRVIEIPGWRTRGHGGLATRPQGVLVHHTAGRPTPTDPYPSLEVVRDGRPGLDGPLSQLGLGGDLAVRVIAAGRCWHAGATFETWQNNDHSLGIEAEHPGGDAPWPRDMYEAYVALTHAIWQWYDFPLSHVVGHKEAAKPLGRKPDPTFRMAAFRTAVAAPRAAGEDWLDMATQAEVTEAVKDGVLAALTEYGRNLFADERGTADTLVDEARAHRAAELAALGKIEAAVKGAGT